MKKFKHYGLTGKTVKVKLKKGHSEAYPWQGKAVAVLITGEYDNFLSGTFFHTTLHMGSVFQNLIQSQSISMTF